MTIEQSARDICVHVLALVQNALIDCGRAPINRAYVGAGEIPWDDCCGLLVVTPTRTFRSMEFPTEFNDIERCDGGYIAVDLNVALVRCVPTLDDRGRIPTLQKISDAYEALIEDAAVVMNAVMSDLPNDWIRASVAQTFIGAEGGCIGVQTTLTIGIEQSMWAICCAEPVPYVPGGPICVVPASAVTFVPCEDLESTNVQDAICELAASGGSQGPQGPQGSQGPQGPQGASPARSYGSFYSTVDQVAPGLNTAHPIEVATDDIVGHGVTVVNGPVHKSRITFANAGVYDIQFSLQFHYTGGGGSGHTVEIWLAKNGTSVPWTGTRVDVISNSPYVVSAWDFMVDANANDYFELMWSTDNLNIVLDANSSVTPSAEIPSVIVTVMQVS